MGKGRRHCESQNGLHSCSSSKGAGAPGGALALPLPTFPTFANARFVQEAAETAAQAATKASDTSLLVHVRAAKRIAPILLFANEAGEVPVAAAIAAFALREAAARIWPQCALCQRLQSCSVHLPQLREELLPAAVPPLTCRLQLWAGFERLRSDEDLRNYRDPLRGRVDLVAKADPKSLHCQGTETSRAAMKSSLVFLALLPLVAGSRFKRSSSLRVKPAGPLLEDLALSADGPADKAKKETDDSKVKAAESSDKDKESKAEKIAESVSEEQASADKPSEKSGEEAAKKEATSKGKTQVTKEDTKKDAEAIKEKREPAKMEVETAKDESKPTKATAEQAAKGKDENETKDKAKTSEKESEVAKEKADAKSEKADAAKPKEAKTDENEEKAPAAAPAAEAAVDKKEKDKAKESADSKGGTTSTTLSVYDAPNVTTTIGPVDNETLSAYMKECAQQLKAIVKKAEAYYTHEQLFIALRQECDLDKEFPTVRKDCRKFAEDLGAAREAELKGDTNAYSECCWTAWQEKSQAVGTPLASALLVLLLAWMM
eukprot:s3208_g3.t1